jgi:NAD(P)H-nitrite reductase large subunit
MEQQNLAAALQQSILEDIQRAANSTSCSKDCTTCKERIENIGLQHNTNTRHQIRINNKFTGRQDARNNDDVSEASTIRDLDNVDTSDTLAQTCSIKFQTASPEYINKYMTCWSGHETIQETATKEPDLSIYQVNTHDYHTKNQSITITSLTHITPP